MAARIVKRGSSDYGHVSAECDAPECLDASGRIWSRSHSRRTTEGYRLAERDVAEHNAYHHKETETP